MHAGALLVHHQRAARGLWAGVTWAEAVQVHVDRDTTVYQHGYCSCSICRGGARDHRQAPSRTPAIMYMWLSLAACFY